ncbi:MAG TPA: ABATE domain-containing protein, partial [Candidatus Dormibacteraeota bacterium]|nr:ABATE domain-containing protein [Candidatus Dormibacteraeota bacterium]
MNSDPEPSQTRPFELIAGHAALDFVNTLDDRFTAAGPLERLRDYADLLRFMVQAQLLEGARAQALGRSVNAAAGARALRAARELREAMAGTLYPGVEVQEPSATALRTLTQHF